MFYVFAVRTRRAGRFTNDGPIFRVNYIDCGDKSPLADFKAHAALVGYTEKVGKYAYANDAGNEVIELVTQFNTLDEAAACVVGIAIVSGLV